MRRGWRKRRREKRKKGGLVRSGLAQATSPPGHHTGRSPIPSSAAAPLSCLSRANKRCFPLSFSSLLLPLPPRTTPRPVRSTATWRRLLLDGRRGSKDNAAARGCSCFCFLSRLLVRETSQSSLSLLPIPHRSPSSSRCRSLWLPPQAI